MQEVQEGIDEESNRNAKTMLSQNIFETIIEF